MQSHMWLRRPLHAPVMGLTNFPLIYQLAVTDLVSADAPTQARQNQKKPLRETKWQQKEENTVELKKKMVKVEAKNVRKWSKQTWER